jgi:hypothetical protein
MLRRDPMAVAIDDTGFPKKGRESVGLADSGFVARLADNQRSKPPKSSGGGPLGEATPGPEKYIESRVNTTHLIATYVLADREMTQSIHSSQALRRRRIGKDYVRGWPPNSD